MHKNKIKCKSRIAKRMIDKSIEAFILAIETFNKPTIKYRVEAFSYLICNAWELLLKSYMLETRGKKSIYYKDNSSRTISLDFAIRQIFTNENDPLRINLESINNLRNISTHFITQEYESIYSPLFQACINNYIDKIDQFFDIDMNEYIRFPFLMIPSYQEEISSGSFKHRYGKEVFNQYLKSKESITEYIERNPNDKYAVSINIAVAIVKDPEKASVKMALSKDADEKVTILTKVKDVNTTFPFNQKRALITINKQLERSQVAMQINSYHFQTLCKHFKLYDDTSMCYQVKVDKTPRKMFSNKLIDFIITEIKKDPDIVSKIKQKNS